MLILIANEHLKYSRCYYCTVDNKWTLCNIFFGGKNNLLDSIVIISIQMKLII